MSWWFPENIVEHNSLLNIQGDSPYYHVAQDIYNALISAGGYTPSALNPFITEDYMLAEIAAGAYKSAYGIGDKAGFVVDNFLGINTNGTYSGDVGFTAAPKVIITGRSVKLTTDTSACWVLWTPPVTFSVGFSQAGVTYIGGPGQMDIEGFQWLSVGQ